MLKHASPRVVETAPKAQAKTTWWHDVVDHCVDILALPSSAGGHAHLVLSSFCLSQGMESDSLFHDLFVGVWLMPDLSAVLPIPSLSALPVHRANQVPSDREGLADDGKRCSSAGRLATEKNILLLFYLN